MKQGQRRGTISRREFITASAAAAALVASGNYAHAQGSDRIRIGLVGCGGRGRGALQNAVSSADGVEVWALGDLFQDPLDVAKGEVEKLGSKNALKPEHCFAGIDAYRQVIGSGANYIILATPPGFRPLHLRAAVEAGKNVFAEKPVAVDAPGVRSVIESGEMARQKGLSIVTGTQRRHQQAYIDTIQRIHDGAIGEVTGAQVYWNQGGLWNKPRESSWGDLEWQIRNWLYFSWLSGDHIVEQHVHNLDVANWVMDGHPVKALGVGGRQVRTDPAFGHIYDHFAIEFEYPNGARVLSMCRQIDNTASRVSERVVGTRGSSDPSGSIRGAEQWRYEGPRPNPYEVEHADLIASIRAGKPLNEARRVAESTLTAILGRECAYTGDEITWDQMLNTKTTLMPPQVLARHHEPGVNGSTQVLFSAPLPVAPVAMPGTTKLEREWNG